MKHFPPPAPNLLLDPPDHHPQEATQGYPHGGDDIDNLLHEELTSLKYPIENLPDPWPSFFSDHCGDRVDILHYQRGNERLKPALLLLGFQQVNRYVYAPDHLDYVGHTFSIGTTCIHDDRYWWINVEKFHKWLVENGQG